MIEVIEMVQTLQRMGTDTYQECKYTLLADSRRPLQIGMKEEEKV